MKVSDNLRIAFKKLAGGKKWWGSEDGCDNAQTAAQAADYIEKFAHNKWETP